MNEPAPKRKPAETDALLADPQVVKAIAGALRSRGYPAGEIEDGVAEVQKRALERAEKGGERPTTVEGWRALGVGIAQNVAVSELRQSYARRRTNLGPCEDPDAHAAPRTSGERDPVDAKRQLELLREHLDEEGPEAAELLERVAAGENQSDIAREMNQPPHRVHKRLWNLRGSFAAKLAMAGIAIAVMWWFFVFYMPGRDQEAHHDKAQPQQQQPQPVPSALPPSVPVDTTQPPVASGQPQAPASPQEQAAKLRAQALDLCQKNDWDGCNSLLDAAFRLDPHEDAKTKALHDEAYQKVLEEIRDLEAKPGLKGK